MRNQGGGNDPENILNQSVSCLLLIPASAAFYLDVAVCSQSCTTYYDLLICVVFIQVVVIRDGSIVNAQKAPYGPQCVAIRSDASEVAVGGGEVSDILRFSSHFHLFPLIFDRAVYRFTD